VSFGTTYFSNPLLDPEIKAAGLSKILNYGDVGVTLASEAISTQEQMDILGRFGWELVSIVGTIGGDQEFVFKRPYDSQRSQQEAEIIKLEGAKLVEIINTPIPETPAEPQLVDLDRSERELALTSKRQEYITRATSLLSPKGFTVTEINAESNIYDPENEFRVSANVLLDVTDIVENGNQFRGSVAQEQVDAYLQSLGLTESRYNSPTCLLDGLEVRVQPVILFNNKYQKVGSGTQKCFDVK
jgi:hypothetical protein